MSDILLNLDFSCAGGFGGTKSEPHASSKHERFMRSRRYLERKGCLNKKQIPKHRQKHTQGQGQGQAQGQGQRLGQAQGQRLGQGQGQGQRLGQAQGQRLGQGQAQGQGQRLGQAQGQRLGQGQGQGQRLGQAQGQRLGQGQGQRLGQGQAKGQRQGQKLGQGQAQWQGQRLGQGQKQGKGQDQGQKQGHVQGRTPMPQYTPNHTPESPHPQQNGSRCTPAPSRPQLATSSASSPHPKPPPTTASPAFQPPGEQLLSEFQSGLPRTGQPFKCVAVDCEMVGTGPMGKRSELARCSIVGYDGDVIYDQYILPVNRVTDYRSRWSGIRPHHLRQATPFQVAKKQIMKLLQGKVVVGHAIHNDFKALEYFHPPALTRDTSRIPLLNARAGLPAAATPSLKNLTRAILSRDIQVGRKGHSSVEDARATMELYKTVEVQWESTLARKSSTTQDGGGV